MTSLPALINNPTEPQDKSEWEDFEGSPSSPKRIVRDPFTDSDREE
jgi:hypothetical protein